MITWRSTAHGYDASLEIGGVVFALMHARADAWQIEYSGGQIEGPAASVGQAKRAVLEKLAELLPRALREVEVALRSA